MTRRYVGIPEERTATGGRRVDVIDDRGFASPLNPRNDIWNHSPNGFEWGYEGSGPAQLALAILADHLAYHPPEAIAISDTIGEAQEDWSDGRPLGDRAAIRLHQHFKRAVLSPLRQGDPFELGSDEVSAFIEAALARKKT